MNRLKIVSNKIPYWAYNLIGFISGIIGIASPIVGAFLWITGRLNSEHNEIIFFVIISIIYISIVLVLFIKMKKYRAVMSNVICNTSEEMYSFLRESRNILFDILKYKKRNQLSVHLLNQSIENYFENSLDSLCNIIKSFTGQEVSACIKIIVPEDADEEIKLDNARVKTFVRSKNTDPNRKNSDEYYENGEIPRIMDNSDFRDILDPKSPMRKSYFYKKSLIEHAKEEAKNDRSYDNTTKNWEKYYKSTIVVPIRIKHKRLYFSNKDKYFHVIGFLCVDSLSENAFLEKQERYNVDIVKAFAAEAYIILSKYQFYLKKMEKEKNV